MRKLAAGLLALLPLVSFAEDNQIGEDYVTSFLNYQPYKVPVKKEEKKKEDPASASQAPKTGEQPVDFDWLKKNMETLMQRAITNPTEANVSAYMYAQRITLDKAQRLAEVAQEINRQDPALNENNRIPYASAGAMSVRNADYKAQQNAVEELSKTGGLIVFVDGSCRFCSLQLPIIDMIKNNYGMEAIVVSVDGKRPSNYTGPLLVDNGLWKKLNLKLSPSIVYVDRPKGYGGKDPNRYMVVAQGFYAQDELVKQIAYAGYQTKILSPKLMADLDVWNRGVASVEDLNSLTLDADRPETFREKVQPILLKQYSK